jgi:hypothetical protein
VRRVTPLSHGKVLDRRRQVKSLALSLPRRPHNRAARQPGEEPQGRDDPNRARTAPSVIATLVLHALSAGVVGGSDGHGGRAMLIVGLLGARSASDEGTERW